MLGAQVIWHLIPFGFISGNYTPVIDFSANSGVKIENDMENGSSRVSGRTLQTCDFSVHVSKATGGNPRAIFEMLDKLKGLSSPIYISNGASVSLSNQLLDMIQTTDWTRILTLDGALGVAKSLIAGTAVGGVSFVLRAVEIEAPLVNHDGSLIDAIIHLSFIEDAGQRQTGGLKVFVNDKDITSKIAVSECIYENHAEGEADSLMLKFADTKNEWTNWKLEETDMIKVTDGVLNTGQMFVESLKPENGTYTLRAMSVPKKAFAKRSRSFENLALPQIAKKIAEEHKLTLKNYGVTELKIPYVQQKMSDLAFLAERCQRAGASFLVFDKTLCLYDEREIEKRDASKVITLSLGSEFSVIDDSSNAYASAEVSNASHTGKAIDAETKNGKTYLETITENVRAASDMNRVANAILRTKNKLKKTAVITMSVQRELVAGSVIQLVATGWMGKAFIYRIRHDLQKKTSKIWVRKPLDY